MTDISNEIIMTEGHLETHMKTINLQGDFEENCIYENSKIDISAENFNTELSLSEQDTNELLDCTQFPVITKKSGRHQLHPFSTTTTIIPSELSDESSEMLLKVEPLDNIINTKPKEKENMLLLDDCAVSDTVLPNFPTVTKKPGQFHLHPYSATTLERNTTNNAEESSSGQKRGTLSRMLKNLRSGHKFPQDEKYENDIELQSKGTKKDVPHQIEGNQGKGPGTLGRMLSKMNNVSKESKTNISKAIHRISDAISSATKHNKRGEQSEINEKSNNALKITAKEKCASLSRKVSSLGSQFSKQNVAPTENIHDQKYLSDHPSEGNFDSSAKLSSNEKRSSLTRKISSIGSHFRSKVIQNSGSGEVTTTDVNENVKPSTKSQEAIKK